MWVARIVEPTYVPDAQCAQLYRYTIEDCRQKGRRSLNLNKDSMVKLFFREIRRSIWGKNSPIKVNSSFFNFSDCLPAYGIEIKMDFFSTVCTGKGGCRILCINLLIWRKIMFFGYPFCEKYSTRNEISLFRAVKVELTVYARNNKVFTLFSLKIIGTKLKKLEPKPLNVLLRYTLVVNWPFILWTVQSRKASRPTCSTSLVNVILLCFELRWSKNSEMCSGLRKRVNVSSIYLR